ncbi:hypothetical protein G6M87_08420 [Rhizobium rhizogenes]|uniref:hypothetical protein n=1 Tax=Rhizobium rhizogenes TaxID=359 RepID=UPI0005A0B08C|nr:hypothetical protein [Rhizobium rhizogenes]OCJ25346.1 hypothetical protein A6U88_02415 [Agrobacterium sp. B131/95]QTG05498.1 hypothetical protein G6M87_08420 [Rhizobium rhizogenes]
MSGIVGMIGWFDPENNRDYRAIPFKVVDANAAWIAVIFYDGDCEWSAANLIDAKDFISRGVELHSAASATVADLLRDHDDLLAGLRAKVSGVVAKTAN